MLEPENHLRVLLMDQWRKLQKVTRNRCLFRSCKNFNHEGIFFVSKTLMMEEICLDLMLGVFIAYHMPRKSVEFLIELRKHHPSSFVAINKDKSVNNQNPKGGIDPT